MTETFKIRILYLIAELFAHTFVFLCPLQTAGTIPTRPLEAVLDLRHDFCISVQCYFHCHFSNLAITAH